MSRLHFFWRNRNPARGFACGVIHIGVRQVQDKLLLVAEILHMDIGSEPGVIRQIPAGVIWIVVQHDVVAVPQPIVGVVVLVRRDVPVKAAKPETVAASAFKAIDVVAADFAAEASVFPYMVLMITSIVAAPLMTDPAIAVRMNVRSFGVTLLVSIRWTAFAANSVASLCLN
jgi:hypothetical protein